MALTGNNGDNETNIGSSSSLDYSLYDENNNNLLVSNLNQPIELWITKGTSIPIQPYIYVNAINVTNNNSLSKTIQFLNGFIVTGLKLTGTNVSLSVQIKPENMSIGYLALLKFGDNPVFNTTNMDYYDSMSIFCPDTDLVQETNDTFYLIFANMSRVNSYKVLVKLFKFCQKFYPRFIRSFINRTKG